MAPIRVMPLQRGGWGWGATFPQPSRAPWTRLGPLPEVDFLSGFRAQRDGSGLRGKYQDSAGQTRAPRDGSGLRKTDQGPAGRIRAHETSRPRWRNQDEAGPPNTNQSLARQIRAPQLRGESGLRKMDQDQDPDPEGRIRPAEQIGVRLKNQGHAR